MPTVTQNEILKLVELQLGRRGVQADDRLVEDLGAESADVANLVAAAEEKYRIAIKESELARIDTPQDLFELVVERSKKKYEN
jgi:acyl carrier protein